MPWSKANNYTGHTRGIDVSMYQAPHRMNWQIIKAVDKIDFVYIKASGRTKLNYSLQLDDKASAHVKGAKSVGLPIGFYHFARVKTGSAYVPLDAIKDAQFFIKAMTKHMSDAGYTGIGDLMPVLDLEYCYDERESLQKAVQIVDWAWNFCKYITKETGRQVIIYTCPHTFNDWGIKPHMNALQVLPLWAAEYTTKEIPSEFGGWRDWTIWQYTDKGRLKGYNIGEHEEIEKCVDLNWGPKSVTALMRPSAPRGLYAIMQNNGSVLIKWERCSEDAVMGYIITVYMNGIPIDTKMTPNNIFELNSIPRGGLLSFSVQAAGPYEFSPLSEIVPISNYSW